MRMQCALKMKTRNIPDGITITLPNRLRVTVTLDSQPRCLILLSDQVCEHTVLILSDLF